MAQILNQFLMNQIANSRWATYVSSKIDHLLSLARTRFEFVEYNFIECMYSYVHFSYVIFSITGRIDMTGWTRTVETNGIAV